MQSSLSTIAMSCLALTLLSLRLPAHDLADVVDPSASVRKVTGECKFTEGPASGAGNTLLFSDIPNNRIVEILPDGMARDFLKPSGKANGLMFDLAGSLYACQGGDRRVVRIDDIRGSKKITVLADSFDGKKLNSPNDLALDGHGGIYFTDPRYNSTDGVEQPVMGVYYIAASGKVTRVIDSLERPNGILVSPDGKSLHVAEPNRRELYRFTIDSPGKVSHKKLVFTGDPQLDGGGPDGMAHDVHGHIYATYKGIVVLDEGGKLLGRIPVPEGPANCAFGGADRKTLYITARTSLYAIDMKVAGMALRPGARSTAASTSPRDVTAGKLTLKIPGHWTQKEIPPFYRRFRLAQFDIPAVKGDATPAELIVYHFPGGAGTDEANLERWIGQFSAEGRKSTTSRGTSRLGRHSMVEISGTYNKRVGPPVQRKTTPVPGARMLAVILHTADATYYLKLTGLDRTVAASKKGLMAAFGAVD